MDVRGTCCEAPLSPQGVCCPVSTPMDSCGVCGGLSMCTAVVTINAADIGTSGRRAQEVGALSLCHAKNVSL